MTAIDFAMIGSGWRSEFYLRVAQALPDRFRVAGLVTRDAGKGATIASQWGIATWRNIDEMLRAATPAFVVVSVPPSAAPTVIKQLAGRGQTVLTETPPAMTREGMEELAELAQTGARIQVAEQCSFQPLQAARLAVIASGRLGDPTFAHLSYYHGYHATGLLRRFLGVGHAPATITARAFEADIVEGPGRGGWPEHERIVRSRQIRAELDFGGKLASYDFTGDQYFSPIRSVGALIRGSRGELHDLDLRYLEDFRTPIQLSLVRQDAGATGNLEGLWHKGYLAGAEWIYRNPFPGARLSDDEIALATLLAGMCTYVEQGDEIYPLKEGIRDQFLSLAIEEAVRTGAPVIA
ncbi:MAG TPA: Gfo/Idh/MocA family oxidoreductase [Reyranella sp.]